MILGYTVYSSLDFTAFTGNNDCVSLSTINSLKLLKELSVCAGIVPPNLREASFFLSNQNLHERVALLDLGFLLRVLKPKLYRLIAKLKITKAMKN